MPTISAVTPSTRRAQRQAATREATGESLSSRYSIAVDGATLGDLSLDAIERLDLHVGAEVSDRVIAEITRETQALRTYDRAVTLLAAHARASKELERLLVKKGEPAALAKAAVARLAEQGFLDDASFARQFARTKLAGGLSRRRMQAELARRGIARDVADTAIDEVVLDDDVNEAEACDRVATRKMRSLRDLAPDVQRRRLYAFLARRGYEPDDVRAVVDRLVGRGRS